MNEKVTQYINSTKWTQELKILRSFLLELPLEETIKWNVPAYLYKNKNIIGMAAYKNYFGLWFHQGVFLKDKQRVLINAQENKTKALRQWRFYKLNDIDRDLIKRYVYEAMKNVELGKELKPIKNTTPVIIPSILEEEFSENHKLNLKFKELTTSKKREYSEYLISAKKETTKQKRLEKIVPMILNGIGLNDKYKKR